jgi:hypothetical protein
MQFGLLFIGSSFSGKSDADLPLKPTRPASNAQVATALPNDLHRVTSTGLAQRDKQQTMRLFQDSVQYRAPGSTTREGDVRGD